MPRPARITAANYVYHVLNRSAKRALLFVQPSDYRAFEKLLEEAQQRVPIRILAYCLMPNHWHLLLWPLSDGDLPRFVKWLTTTHAIRWNRAHHCVGTGAVYQSRFKSIPVQHGPHLFWAWRYVERNALRANLVARAEEWPWSSLRCRALGDRPEWLNDGPIPLPPDWTEVVNIPQTDAELAAFRHRMNLNQPFGREGWLMTSLIRKSTTNLRKS
jgi:putative transposase